MPKFRKKPVVIDAWQLTEESFNQHVPDWLSEAFKDYRVWVDPIDGPAISIMTLDGTLQRADLGDWIIRGVKGELYPCKPDIFAATYEPAE